MKEKEKDEDIYAGDDFERVSENQPTIEPQTPVKN
jgi:hypothetical protein